MTKPSSSLCKATNKNGQPCKLTANDSGFCHIHSKPKSAAKKTRAKKQKPTPPKDRMSEVLVVIHRTCKAKGWNCLTTSIDESAWRYATVSVERYTPGGYSNEKVAGFFDITSDSSVIVKPNNTSFHSHGLHELHESIMAELERLPWLESRDKKKEKPLSAIMKVEGLLKRFHVAARILRDRYDDRESLIINDEYDVQDFLHALLRTVFDDVRPEEHTPSYAGSSSRIDFLLKAENVAVEVKFAKRTLRDKQIGEQLIIDIKRYQSHPNSKHLICFVYDPGNWIKNPPALENDLSGKHDNINVSVYVVPQ